MRRLCEKVVRGRLQELLSELLKASEMLVAPRISEYFGLPWSALICYSLPWMLLVLAAAGSFQVKKLKKLTPLKSLIFLKKKRAQYCRPRQTIADHGRPKYSDICGATSISDAFITLLHCRIFPEKKCLLQNIPAQKWKKQNSFAEISNA